MVFRSQLQRSCLKFVYRFLDLAVAFMGILNIQKHEKSGCFVQICYPAILLIFVHLQQKKMCGNKSEFALFVFYLP